MNTTKDNLPENIQSASSIAQKILFEAQKSIETRKSLPSGFQIIHSTEQSASGSGISIIKEPEFEDVAGKPKSPLEIAQELAEQHDKKTSPIFLSKEMLTKKISPITQNKEPSLSKKNIPVPGEDSDKQSALIKAPIDYKIFKDYETWDAFTSSHKGKLDKSCKSVDFTREEIVILVSMSEFPSGIFKTVEVLNSKKETIIRYRIDPLAMSTEHIPREYDHYSCAVIEKNNLPVRLEQVP